MKAGSDSKHHLEVRSSFPVCCCSVYWTASLRCGSRSGGGGADAVSFHTDGKCLFCIQLTVFAPRDERLRSNEAETRQVKCPRRPFRAHLRISQANNSTQQPRTLKKNQIKTFNSPKKSQRSLGYLFASLGHFCAWGHPSAVEAAETVKLACCFPCSCCSEGPEPHDEVVDFSQCSQNLGCRVNRRL